MKSKAENTMKKTLVINLFAGPGSGKSTGAAYIFSQLKMAGIDAEYISEYAKDKTWEENDIALSCQIYVSGKQAFRVCRCNGKVDVIITDSPILQGIFYTESEILKQAIIEESNKYENYNLFVNRVKSYNPNGRSQTLEEAQKLDIKIKEYLENDPFNPYLIINGDKEGYDEFVEYIKKYLEIIKED